MTSRCGKTLEMASLEGSGPAILHIVVVGFHHQKGSTVEFSYPPIASDAHTRPRSRSESDSDHVTRSLTSSLPHEWRHLPHLALPDGCHNYEQDSVYFTLGSDGARRLYGVACCRQIETQDLRRVGDDVTRSTVQKSVCVLSRVPAFRLIESKLELVTHAYFNNKDFSDVSVIHEAFEDLNASINTHSASQALSLGLSLRPLVLRFQHRLLQIVKALLLCKRVVMYAAPTKQLSTSVLAIASLLPSTLEQQLNPLVAKDEYGFPLGVFAGAEALLPYVCLQQMELLLRSPSESGPLLSGVVNPLFEKQQRRVCDVFVNWVEGLIYIQDTDTKNALHLTNADLRFCSHVSEAVQEHSSPEEPTSFHGSSEWIRTQYKLYLLSLLAASDGGDTVSTDEFNPHFMSCWLKGAVFREWKSYSRDGIVRVDPSHPCEGTPSLGDVRRRLVAQASDYGLNEQLKEQVVEETQRVLTEAAGRVSSVVSGAWFSASSALYSWWRGGGGGGQGEMERNTNS